MASIRFRKDSKLPTFVLRELRVECLQERPDVWCSSNCARDIFFYHFGVSLACLRECSELENTPQESMLPRHVSGLKVWSKRGNMNSEYTYRPSRRRSPFQSADQRRALDYDFAVSIA